MKTALNFVHVSMGNSSTRNIINQFKTNCFYSPSIDRIRWKKQTPTVFLWFCFLFIIMCAVCGIEFASDVAAADVVCPSPHIELLIDCTLPWWILVSFRMLNHRIYSTLSPSNASPMKNEAACSATCLLCYWRGTAAKYMTVSLSTITQAPDLFHATLGARSDHLFCVVFHFIHILCARLNTIFGITVSCDTADRALFSIQTLSTTE